MPIFLLYFIQVKNFMKGRTTNERFSRKKPVHHKRSMSGESIDSTGSSLLSVIRHAKEAEDIIKEHGDPRDFTGKSCESIRNEMDMCCSTTPPS